MSATTLPPSTTGNDDAVERATRALVEALNNPEFSKKAFEDISGLAVSIKTLRQGLLETAGELVKVDSSDIQDPSGKPTQFGKDWEPIRKVRLFQLIAKLRISDGWFWLYAGLR